MFDSKESLLLNIWNECCCRIMRSALVCFFFCNDAWCLKKYSSSVWFYIFIFNVFFFIIKHYHFTCLTSQKLRSIFSFNSIAWGFLLVKLIEKRPKKCIATILEIDQFKLIIQKKKKLFLEFGFASWFSFSHVSFI